MDNATDLVLLAGAVVVLAPLARRIGVAAPLLLVVAGVLASYVPAFPEYKLDPDVVLVGILPPLLYAAALRTSLIDARRDKRAIALLSVGLVVFSTLVVGVVAWWLVPGLPLAAGFALGAIVAPPDAVAATAVARRIGLPRRLVNILEGESLVNDAIALVALRIAIAALAGSVTAWRIGFEATVATLGGLVIGVLVAAALIAARRRIDDVVVDTSVSILAPFVAFVVAEKVTIDGAHPSGVLAVVVTGVVLAARSDVIQSGTARLAEGINWETIQFVLENAVFLLVGLQFRGVIDDVIDTDLDAGRIVLVCAAVLVAAIVARFVWMYPATYIPRMIPAIGRRDPPPPWQYPTTIVWAGMRGVVTLAAAAALPQSTPQRPLLVLAAAVVVAGTLLLQGSTLPALARRLHVRGPDPAADALAEAAALQEATRAGLARLDELSDGVPPELLARLRERSLDRANSSWERLGRLGGDETPSETYRRLRLEMLTAERAALQRRRAAGLLEEDLMRELRHLLDIEESLLDPGLDEIDTSEGEPLLAAATESCAHLELDWPEPVVAAAPVCRRCIEEGLRWVHLRVCLACGNIACCDSSFGRHATAHFDETGHPVMRSAEPGELWRWCYVDGRLG